MDKKKVNSANLTETDPPVPKITLASLIERLATDARERDRDFVRELSTWLHENAPQMRLSVIDALDLTDVVLTFQMRRDVELVITGHLVAPHAEVTLKIREDDFPTVWVELLAVQTDDPYTICTLDYARKGEPVEIIQPIAEKGRSLPVGSVAQCLVVSTIGPDTFVRIKTEDSDLPWTVPALAVRFASDTLGRYRTKDWAR